MSPTAKRRLRRTGFTTWFVVAVSSAGIAVYFGFRSLDAVDERSAERIEVVDDLA